MTALFILTVQAEPFSENSSQISCLALACIWSLGMAIKCHKWKWDK